MSKGLLGAAGLLACLVAVSAPAREPLPVTVRAFADVRVPHTRTAPAEVLALVRTPVPARIGARVDSFAVDVGSRLDRGATIARLECVDFEDRLAAESARLEELQARRRLARIRLERTRRLRESNAVAADQLDEAAAEFDALGAGMRSQQSAVDAARRDVGRCTVTAPFAGAITARPVDAGAFVQPGTALVELVDLDRVELRTTLTQDDAATLARGTGATFVAGTTRYPVRLDRLVPTADPATRQREARFTFTGTLPPPGEAGRLRWSATLAAVPANLLVRRGGRLGVMLADGAAARFHAIPQAVEGRPAPVDLPPDARLIVRGRYAATDGMPITTVAAGE